MEVYKNEKTGEYYNEKGDDVININNATTFELNRGLFSPMIRYHRISIKEEIINIRKEKLKKLKNI
jgi:hypothetical protein